MLGRKAIVKSKNGRIFRGWTANIASNKEFFLLIHAVKLKGK